MDLTPRPSTVPGRARGLRRGGAAFWLRDCLTRGTASQYSFAQRMSKAAVVFLSVCACLSSGSAADSVRMPLVQEASRAISGAAEFVLELPLHIRIEPGSRVTLVIHFKDAPPTAAEPLSLQINEQTVVPLFSADPLTLALRVDATPPPETFRGGWNRIVALLPREFGTCEVRRAETHLALNFTRVPLFPELRRFPESVVEEKLLRPDATTPAVSILVPAQRRDAHLRGCAILAARLGQQRYVDESDFDIVELGNWPAVESRNAIIVARADELGGLPIPAELKARAQVLGEGQGLVADLILGDFPNERRWVLAAGRDDAGLEKAALTLGSQPALNTLAPSPAVITIAPEVDLKVERLASPMRGRPTFRELGWRDFEIGGAPERRFGWRLPPGYSVASGELILNFLHPKETSGGVLDAFVGDTKLGEVKLTDQNADGGSIRLALPQGLAGTDPMMLTFRAATTNSRHRGPIAVVLANSYFDTIVEPARISGLQHLDTLLTRDSFLRHIAFVVPADAPPGELKMMCDIALGLGRRLPSSPILWPEACSFDSGRQPLAARLQDRSAVMLAPLSRWHEAFGNAPLLIKQSEPGSVRMQGRRSSVSDYEPSLTLMQMTPAPWARDEWLVTVGGWNAVDAPATKELVSAAATRGTIYGNMAAVDRRGRSVAHDSRRPAVESFAQRLNHHIPPGVDVAQTARRVGEARARYEQSILINRFLAWFVGIFIAAIVLGRLLLVWERSQSYKKARETSQEAAR